MIAIGKIKYIIKGRQTPCYAQRSAVEVLIHEGMVYTACMDNSIKPNTTQTYSSHCAFIMVVSMVACTPHPQD